MQKRHVEQCNPGIYHFVIKEYQDAHNSNALDHMSVDEAFLGAK